VNGEFKIGVPGLLSYPFYQDTFLPHHCVDLPYLGHEQANRRPVLVFSPAFYQTRKRLFFKYLIAFLNLKINVRFNQSTGLALLYSAL
jgi:hypothetical protein